MQHNLVVVKPGTLKHVGEAADRLAVSVAGSQPDYIPVSDDVLFATPLVSPDSQYVLDFIAPSTPGEYPYLCTFPGHWRYMQGVLEVEACTELPASVKTDTSAA